MDAINYIDAHLRNGKQFHWPYFYLGEWVYYRHCAMYHGKLVPGPGEWAIRDPVATLADALSKSAESLKVYAHEVGKPTEIGANSIKNQQCDKQIETKLNMNREETAKEVARLEALLPIMKAFAEGKRVERNGIEFTSSLWSLEAKEYSIAPEPKLVPWGPEDVPMPCHVRNKGRQTDGYELITEVSDEIIKLSGWPVSYKRLLEDYVQHPSGKPCGKEVAG